MIALEIVVGGLKGGHSGDDIHKGFGNANKILGRVIWQINNDYKIKLSSLMEEIFVMQLLEMQNA